MGYDDVMDYMLVSCFVFTLLLPLALGVKWKVLVRILPHTHYPQHVHNMLIETLCIEDTTIFLVQIAGPCAFTMFVLHSLAVCCVRAHCLRRTHARTLHIHRWRCTCTARLARGWLAGTCQACSRR